ncbi:MAG TPA: glutamate synthase subunit beta [Candidatus Dormibacteraeota bacterium]|nr:glutamate synthase subunit beta [Candidatus Dormibacteraeota bacterium]
MADPLAFLKHPRQLGPDRPPEQRVRDYDELHLDLPAADLGVQAGRCMNCGIAFCHHACPLHNLIPDWNTLVRRDSWARGLERLHRTNNFPEFTGRVCPAPCEASCVLSINDEPVAIKEVERSLIDRGFQEGWVRPQPAQVATGRRVAVVGSGPAGLAAAQQLARAGHAVDVYEEADRPGGLLRYGIPDYKLPKEMVDRRLEQMEAEGVTFHCGVRVGRDVAAAELSASYDAVGLALGARLPRELAIPGRELKGVHLAMDYLEQQNRRVAGAALPPGTDLISAADRRVVILGGGDTGADCLGNAHREGCRSVTQLEIMPEPPRQRAPGNLWPDWPLILRTSPAHEEGGHRTFGVETVAFGSADLRVQWLQLRQMQLRSGPDRRLVPRPVLGSESRLEADLVLLALGFTGAAAAEITSELQLDLDDGGRLRTDPLGRTRAAGVFAFGDAVRGASLVVHAIADGRRGASAIDAALRSAAA